MLLEIIGFCAAVVTVEDSIDPTIVSIPGDITVNNDLELVEQW